MKPQNNNLIKIVHILNDGMFHDGSEMGIQLGVTRSAVWKTIQKLQDYGIAILSIKGKGYQLQTPLILFDREQILYHLPSTLQNSINLIIFESIDSTNTYLQNLLSHQKTDVCLAEMQTQGRARFARTWHSPFGENIYMSIRQFFQKDIGELTGLSLVVGLAVIESIQQYGLSNGLMLKWPNDILYDEKKLAGILIDATSEINGYTHVIIGIGLNVNSLDSNKNNKYDYTSIKKITGKTCDKNKLTGLLLRNIDEYLKIFDKKGLSAFQNHWKIHDYLANKTITVTNNKHIFNGICCGIDKSGYLRLKKDNGDEILCSSGDTSITQYRLT